MRSVLTRYVWRAIGALIAAASLAQVQPAAADPGQSQVVLDTVAARNNGFWTVDPRLQPQIGEGVTLDRVITVNTVVLHPIEIAIAKKWEYLVGRYRSEYMRYLRGKGVVHPVTVLNIWRSNDGQPLPVDPTPNKFGFDVAAGGFTNVYSATYDVPFDLSRPFVLPVEPALTMQPGVYLIAFYMQFPGQPVFGVRFEGEVSGHSAGTWRGTDWIPTICKYAPIPDSSLPGSAAYVADQYAAPVGVAPSGPYPGTIGLRTWFRAGMDKMPEGICTRPDFGGYDKNNMMIDKKGRPIKFPTDQKYYAWQTGDLDMQLLGWAG